MKYPAKTFKWIVDILKKQNIPFVISGGLSAKIYGSPRLLNDIDIDIHDKDINLILKDVEPYITFGPVQYKNKVWDLLLLTLNHEGQEIDISGGDTLRICDVKTGVWHKSPTDFSDIEQREIFGLIVPVISKKDLIEYKSMLVERGHEHQQVDIDAVKNAL